MRQNDVNVITFENCFMMKDARINELINKLFTFANFHQTDINSNDDDRDDYANYVEFKRFASLI